MVRSGLRLALPFGLVQWKRQRQELLRLGVAPRLARRLALRPTNETLLEQTRLNLLPDSALAHMDYVVDVGANEGAWSLGVLAFCRPRRLLVVEPSPSLQPVLQRRLGARRAVTICPVAVGAEKGEAMLHETATADINSLLEPREEMSEVYNGSFEVKSKVRVVVEPLDSIVRELPEVSLLKLDVQGYERFALQGASQTLQKTRFVLLEVNFVSHYHDDTLFWHLHEMMASSGFHLHNISSPFRSTPSQSQGRVLWADALYAREP